MRKIRRRNPPPNITIFEGPFRVGLFTPQLGHVMALVETSLPHSLQALSAMIVSYEWINCYTPGSSAGQGRAAGPFGAPILVEENALSLSRMVSLSVPHQTVLSCGVAQGLVLGPPNGFAFQPRPSG